MLIDFYYDIIFKDDTITGGFGNVFTDELNLEEIKQKVEEYVKNTRVYEQFSDKIKKIYFCDFQFRTYLDELDFEIEF